MTHPMTRRSLLAGASALAAAGALAGCSSGPRAEGDGAQRVSDAVLPKYIAADTAGADLVSADPNGVPAFFRYPEAPKPAVANAPLAGETVSALTYTYDPAAPGVGDNPLWQGVNEGLGGTLDLVYAPSADYGQRFATTIAGGDLPDLVSIFGTVQQLPDLLEAKFTDLTEFLAGDAVADYPNLAAIPTQSWQKAAIGGKLWGIPIPRVPIPGIAFAREDLITGAGLSMTPKTFDEFVDVLTGLVDTKRSVWASGDPGAVLSIVLASQGVSTAWTESGGKFTSGPETEEYEQSLAEVQELWKKGVFHPDSMAANNNQRNDWFTQGVTSLVFGGYAGWSKYEMWGAPVKGFTLGTIPQFGHDSSSTPVHPRGAVMSSMTALAKAEPDRIHTLLQVMDWLAAPFGSSEYLLRKYGIEGETFELEGSDPILNSSGQQMRLAPFAYVADAPQAIYDPGQAEVAQARFDYQEQALPMLAPDPTLGLYSEAEAAKNNQLNLGLSDVRDAILVGRSPVSDWAEAIATWRKDGGDQIRAEFEEAFAETENG